jgi:hypothetical protein
LATGTDIHIEANMVDPDTDSEIERHLEEALARTETEKEEHYIRHALQYVITRE